ncbi:uncharacterized protein LOC6613898 [Drosophila sechellia]|uniref:Uncharacterized protein LOC117143692 n=1 Tax=Drosophila mauritiana TaxID=7226 RepID=A0A6P8K637_DROMA|nr:uncharacterized protein LOC6613898 [Drosophila sechellia]XP_033164375.1 uncharacterized protein LOC117143692 [Drosophila mauritiana]
MSSRLVSLWILVLSLSYSKVTPAYGRGYQLEINHPDGSAFRRESVIADTDGNSELDGEIKQKFPAPHEGWLLLSYKIGSKGYNIRYSYKADSDISVVPMVAKNETFSIKRIGVNALKSTAG